LSERLWLEGGGHLGRRATRRVELFEQGSIIHTIDWIIIVTFLAGFAGFGLWQGRSNRTTEDYFLGKRQLPWPVAMFSLVATETSVLTFISIPGLAYTGNWCFLQLAMGYILGRIAVSVVLLPRYMSGNVTSIYEVLGQRFGPGIQRVASGVFLVTRVLADGVRFLATAVIVQAITGWDLSVSVLIIGGVTLVYTLSGGIKTVVWVDTFQFAIYLLGAVFCIVWLLGELNQPVAETLKQLARSDKTTIFQWSGAWHSDPWFAFSAVIGGVLLSFASHGADYMMVQRVLGCRSLSSARKAMIGSGLFVFMQFGLFLLVGSLIFLFLDGKPLVKDREFSSFIVNHLPMGVRGFLLAGVLSAAMSTLSSSINSLASSTLMDWFKKKATLKLSRWVSLFWAGVLISVALVFDESDEAVVVLGIQIASFTYGGLLGLFLLSKSKRNFHPASLIVSLIGSLAAVFVLKHYGLAWTWFVGAGVVVFIVLAYIIDLLLEIPRTGPPRPPQR